MKINRKIIYEFYKKEIDKIEDENLKNELLGDLEKIDDMLYSLENKVEEEIDYQENHLPSTKEYLDDFEACRKELML